MCAQHHPRLVFDEKGVLHVASSDPEIQCIVGKGSTRFGAAQQPGLFDYADGVDTMQFLLGL